jgi:hypothetical protein
MRVRCIKLINEDNKTELELADGTISIGHEYEVLSLCIKSNGQYVEIKPDNSSKTVLKNLELFEIVEDSIPPNWGVYYTPQTGIEFTAKA